MPPAGSTQKSDGHPLLVYLSRPIHLWYDNLKKVIYLTLQAVIQVSRQNGEATMTCKEFEELSGAFVLGAVTAEEREAARLHLTQCKACARLYQELRSVVALLPRS